MLRNLNQIKEGHAQFIDGEEVLSGKRLETEIWERDIYQKQRVNIAIEREIQKYLDLIAEADMTIEEKKNRIQQLIEELQEAEAELQEFHNDNAAKDEELIEMEQNIQTLLDDKAREEADEQERKRKENEELMNRPKPKKKYAAVQGDRVDEFMAQYMNNFDLDIPVQRLGDGNYMFGSRKIYAKIMNDKLVVRVGGGYMLIDEFLATYGRQEMDKLEAIARSGNGGSFKTSAMSPT